MAMQIQRYTPWQDGGNTYEDDNGGYVLYSDVEAYVNARVREVVRLPKDIDMLIDEYKEWLKEKDEDAIYDMTCEWMQDLGRSECLSIMEFLVSIKAKVLEAYPVEVKG